MQEQNYQNHSRIDFLYHRFSAALLLAIIIGACINLFNCNHENLYSASLIVALSLLVGLVAYFARAFALKAQDRAIRAEESLRHFVLTGNLLSTQLKMSQIVALRFASDDEFVALAQKAVEEKLNSKQIKQAIKNWKADNNRV